MGDEWRDARYVVTTRFGAWLMLICVGQEQVALQVVPAVCLVLEECPFCTDRLPSAQSVPTALELSASPCRPFDSSDRIRDHVAATEAQLHEQQEALRGLLAAQGLGPAAGQAQSTAAQHGQGQPQRQQVSLPSRATLLSYTAQQLAGVEAELAALGAAEAAEAGEDDIAGRAET